MAEVEIEIQKCSACSSEVRPNSQFCFHCGAAIEAKTNKKGNMSDAWFKESIVEIDESQAVKRGAVAANVEKKAITKTEEVSEPKTVAVAIENLEKPENVDVDSKKLKSAASIRNKPKTILKKSVEIVWEEPENSLNIWSVLVALLLIAIAAGLIIAAWYLR